jgi:toxin ParE1/3/4
VKYKISIEAEVDLENIWLYTVEKWSIKQADRYIDLILNEFEYLNQNPNAGKDFSHVIIDYKCAKVKSHLIFYLLNKRNNCIEIIRVLHQRMDIINRLTE